MSGKETGKKEVGEKQVTDYVVESGLLAEKTSTKNVTIEGMIYTIKPLPESILTIIGNGENFDGYYNKALHILKTCRFGIVNAKPVKGKAILDSDGREVKFGLEVQEVMGELWDVVSYDFLKRLKKDVASKLFIEITNHSLLDDKAADSLDFTTDSEPQE